MMIIAKDDEVNKVMEEMQTTIKEVKESEYYRHMVHNLQNNKRLRNRFLRVMGNNMEHGRLRMVVYCVGSIQTCYRAQYQLSLAILLSRDLSNWIEGTMEFYDPGVTPVDVKVMAALGCKVLDKIGKSPVVLKPTFIFMPFAPADIFDYLVLANLCGSRLKNIVLFTQSRHGTSKEGQKYGRSKEEQKYKSYRLTLNTISRHAVKFNCETDCKTKLPFYENKKFEARWPFLGLSWWFFNLSMFNANQLEAMWMEAGIWRKDGHMYGKKESCIDDLFPPFDAETQAFDYMEDDLLKVKDWSVSKCSERYPGSPARRNWCPPSHGWIKLNFSAAAAAATAIENNYKVVLGYGGIFHNEYKECLRRYSYPLPNEGAAASNRDEDLDFANAKALKKGLILYMYMRSRTTLMGGRRKLVVEGDSVSIVRWVNGIFPPPKRLAGIVEQIRGLMSVIHDEHVVFHIYKEANSMAIDLANQGAKLLI